MDVYTFSMTRTHHTPPCLSSGVSGVPLLLSHHRALYVIRDWGRRAWSVWDSWDCFSTAIWSGRLTHTYKHSLCEPRLYMPPDQTSLQELLNRFRGSPCLFLSTFSFQGPRADQMAGHVLRVNGAFLHWIHHCFFGCYYIIIKCIFAWQRKFDCSSTVNGILYSVIKALQAPVCCAGESVLMHTNS